MIKIDYLENKSIPVSHISGRNFMVMEDVEVTLSNGSLLFIPKGFHTDFMSVPYWLWSFITPIDNGLLGDIIHDALWSQEEKSRQILIHGSVVSAKTFSDYERHKWRKCLSPSTKIKNRITTYFLKRFSMKYYTGEKKMNHWKNEI